MSWEIEIFNPEVFTLMREAWEIGIFPSGSLPFDAGNHMEVWEIEMFTTGS